MCLDCYNGSQAIQAEITHTKKAVMEHDIAAGHTFCTRCGQQLIDDKSARAIRNIVHELIDHDGIPLASSTLTRMIETGVSWSIIEEELGRGTVVCSCCHSVMAFACKQFGVPTWHRLKDTSSMSVQVCADVTSTLYDQILLFVDRHRRQ